MIGQYLIHFTDGETTLIIEPGEINYDTSLILFGRDTPSWGQYLNDNFIRLLEHFSNDYSPGYLSGVMVGQLWFDTTTNQLRVCKDSEKLLWDPLCNNTSPDLVDLVTYDNIAEYTSSYIKKSGSTLTGPLYVKYPVYALDVANIRYVSKIVCLCADNKTQYSNYVNMVGGSINTKILLGGTTTVGAAAAPKSTVDGKRRNSLSRSTSGIVLIEGDGTLREGAKTMISSSNGSILCVHGSGEFATTKVSCTIKFNNFKLKPTYRVIVNGYNKSTAASGITSPSNDYSDVFVSDITSESFKVTRTISEFDMIFYFMVDGEIDDGSTPTSTVANATKQATLPTGAAAVNGSKQLMPPTRQPKNFLLAVGINKYQHKNYVLRGPANDAEDMVGTFEKLKCETYLLVDKQATKANILGKLAELVDNAIEGDRIYFTYAGHGGYGKSQNGEVAIDGEYLLPYDAIDVNSKRIDANLILDSELIPILNRSAVEIECFMDACHSGGLSELGVSEGKTNLISLKNEKVILWTACGPKQYAFEETLGGSDDGNTALPRGVFSYLFAYKTNWGMTRRETLAAIKAGLDKLKLAIPEIDQTPELHCREELLDKLIGGIIPKK